MTGDQPPAPPAAAGPLVLDPGGIQEQVAREALVVSNLKQEVLVVPANEVRLKLVAFERAVKARGAWAGPAALAAGFVGNLLTLKGAATFEPLFGMNRDQWVGANKAALILFGLLALWKGICALRARGPNVDSVVTDLGAPSRSPTQAGLAEQLSDLFVGLGRVLLSLA